MGAIYEIGALCALEESLNGLDFTKLQHYVGVSAGSFIAAALANGKLGRSAVDEREGLREARGLQTRHGARVAAEQVCAALNEEKHLLSAVALAQKHVISRNGRGPQRCCEPPCTWRVHCQHIAE